MKKKSVLYLDVAEKIKSDIMCEKYPVGTLLPTEAELEKMFGVSKITIRKAIELLAADEYVEKKSGKGTTVLSNRPYNKLSTATTFTDILGKSGLDVRKETLGIEVVSLTSTDELYEHFGEQAVKITRLYHLDHQPYIYFEYFLPIALADVTPEDTETDSLYRILDQHGVEIEKFQDSFLSVQLTFEQQKFMITPEPSALKRIRRSFNEDGKVVEYSVAIYNTALYPYIVEFEV